MAGKKPDIKLLFKNKDTGKSTQVAVGWSNDFGGFNFKLDLEETKWATPLLAQFAEKYWVNGVVGEYKKKTPDESEDL